MDEQCQSGRGRTRAGQDEVGSDPTAKRAAEEIPEANRARHCAVCFSSGKRSRHDLATERDSIRSSRGGDAVSDTARHRQRATCGNGHAGRDRDCHVEPGRADSFCHKEPTRYASPGCVCDACADGHCHSGAYRDRFGSPCCDDTVSDSARYGERVTASNSHACCDCDCHAESDRTDSFRDKIPAHRAPSPGGVSDAGTGCHSLSGRQHRPRSGDRGQAISRAKAPGGGARQSAGIGTPAQNGCGAQDASDCAGRRGRDHSPRDSQHATETNHDSACLASTVGYPGGAGRARAGSDSREQTEPANPTAERRAACPTDNSFDSAEVNQGAATKDKKVRRPLRPGEKPEAEPSASPKGANQP